MTTKVLVIGASGDVGQGIVEQLLAGGYQVVAAGRDLDKLRAVEARLGEPPGLDLIAGSIADEAAAATLGREVRRLAPSLAGVVVSVNGPLQTMALAEAESGAVLEVVRGNLLPHLIAARQFIPTLPQGAAYVAIGGGMADLVVPGMGVLSMCQAAQRAMYAVLARELADTGVRIHNLMLYSMIAGHSNRDRHHPKWITAEEVGRHLVAVLAHPEWFPEVTLALRSRGEAGQRPADPAA